MRNIITTILATLVAAFIFIPMLDRVSEADARDPNCIFDNNDNNTSKRTGHLNGYNVCVTTDYMERLTTKRPYPSSKIEDSIERRNLIEKLLRFNNANKIAYVTLLSDYGTVIATYTIQGKVSSNQSSLTASQQCGQERAYLRDPCVTSPGDDGSYGENEQGIFFFTTAGVLVQWNGKFLLTDAPQQVVSAPVVTYNINDKPTTAGFDIGKP